MAWIEEHVVEMVRVKWIIQVAEVVGLGDARFKSLGVRP